MSALPPKLRMSLQPLLKYKVVEFSLRHHLEDKKIEFTIIFDKSQRKAIARSSKTCAKSTKKLKKPAIWEETNLNAAACVSNVDEKTIEDVPVADKCENESLLATASHSELPTDFSNKTGWSLLTCSEENTAPQLHNSADSSVVNTLLHEAPFIKPETFSGSSKPVGREECILTVPEKKNCPMTLYNFHPENKDSSGVPVIPKNCSETQDANLKPLFNKDFTGSSTTEEMEQNYILPAPQNCSVTFSKRDSKDSSGIATASKSCSEIRHGKNSPRVQQGRFRGLQFRWDASASFKYPESGDKHNSEVEVNHISLSSSSDLPGPRVKSVVTKVQQQVQQEDNVSSSEGGFRVKSTVTKVQQKRASWSSTTAEKENQPRKSQYLEVNPGVKRRKVKAIKQSKKNEKLSSEIRRPLKFVENVKAKERSVPLDARKIELFESDEERERYRFTAKFLNFAQWDLSQEPIGYTDQHGTVSSLIVIQDKLITIKRINRNGSISYHNLHTIDQIFDAVHFNCQSRQFLIKACMKMSLILYKSAGGIRPFSLKVMNLLKQLVIPKL